MCVARHREDEFHEKYLQEAANKVSELLDYTDPGQMKVPAKAVPKKKKKKHKNPNGVEKAAKARLQKLDL